MPTWPSPRSERLGTPNVPAIRFTRGTSFGASRFTHLLRPAKLLAPLYGSDRYARPSEAFTSRLSTDRLPSPLLDMTTTATGLLCWRDFHPLEWQLASLHQTRTCSFPAYGSHLGYPRRCCAVCRPAPGTRVPGTVPGACGAGLPFPSASALGSTGSAAVCSVADCSATVCSTLFVGFTATMAELDFSCPCIIGYDSSSSRCGPSLALDADGQSRDLPASDAIRLHVMWPLTPAGRQHLAFVEERCRTCCLRASKNSRPLRCLTFRGSIPHPVQSLCTLRDHCRQWPRNTRYQADATPYLGRTHMRRPLSRAGIWRRW